MPDSYDAIVLGAGAAGLMCAATAGQAGRRVLLIDHNDEPGRKILISGGGRCNFTNVNARAENYLSANPHFAKSALGRYSPRDFIDLVEAYHIAWHEKTLGQLFCDGSARQVVEMMLAECDKGGVTLSLGHPASAIEHADGQFRVTIDGRTHTAPALVLATGGPSIPKLGATGFAYELARRFGLAVVQPRPALVPLTLGGDEALFRELSGVSTEVEVRRAKAKFREAALFTHRGLSGPAMLQISSYWPHKGDIAGRKNGVLISMDAGEIFTYALGKLDDRGRMFVKPNDPVYEGMIVGIHSRDNDLVVNATRTKQLTNFRVSGKEDAIKITPPIDLTLEYGVEFIEDDELVEITPKSVRLRKRHLKEHDRKRASREA